MTSDSYQSNKEQVQMPKLTFAHAPSLDVKIHSSCYSTTWSGVEYHSPRVNKIYIQSYRDCGICINRYPPQKVVQRRAQKEVYIIKLITDV